MRPIVLMVFVLQGANLEAQMIVHVHDTVDERIYDLRKLEYFVDTTNRVTFGEVSSQRYRRSFRTYDDYLNTDYNSQASYWIRMGVQHDPLSRKAWLLEFYDQTIDRLDVYIPLVNGGYRHLRMGDHMDFEARRFKHKNFDVQLEMPTDTVMTYYFRIKSHEFADVRLAVRSADRFVQRANFEYFLYGTFYGMIVIISLYNFLVYLAIRENKNLIYICYILSVAFYAMSLDGIGFQYLWPAHPSWNDYVSGVFLYSVIVWALLFTQRFLSTKSTSPRLHEVLKWMIIVRSGLFLFSIFVYPDLFAHRILDIIPLSVIFYTGARVWMRGYRPARFFVIAYGILFIGFFVRMLVYLDIIPFNTISHYSLHFSFVLEMLFLTFALGDRIRILKDNRDRAMRRIIEQHEINMRLKDKVTKELEQKVTERTVALDVKNSELEAGNEKLVRQAREINQINSMLDLDNWKLKNRIREVLNERFMDKIMDYDEFRTLYPDDLSCFRSLETLKWEGSYLCRRCGNDRFFSGRKKFSRRCTRCGFNETVTSYTIFHSIKFPVAKAFYLAYLGVSGHREHTLKQLATMLDLGVNTIWSFTAKVQRRLTEMERKGKRPSASRWEEVILGDVRRPAATKANPQQV